MRNVQITRKSCFVGILIPYFIFVGTPKAEINPQNPDAIWDFPNTSNIKISNGKTISVSIPDGKCCILVSALDMPKTSVTIQAKGKARKIGFAL